MWYKQFHKWLIKDDPHSLAPNCVTLSALAVAMAGHLATLILCPGIRCDSNSEDMNSNFNWLYLAGGVGILLYQTIDNMDGKQARRTG